MNQEIKVSKHAIARARQRWGATGTVESVVGLIRHIVQCASFQNTSHGRDWYALGAFVVLIEREQDNSLLVITVKSRVWRDAVRWKR